MSKLLVVARRELAVRKLAWPIALAVGLLSMLTPVIAGDRMSGTGASVWLALWCASCLAALLIGLSLFGPELADGRVRFWLTRPVAQWQILAGKLGGAFALALGIEALVLAPLAIVRTLPPTVSAHDLPVLIGIAVLLVAVGAAAGIMARSRSRRVLADVGGVALVAVAIEVFLQNFDNAEQAFFWHSRGAATWTPHINDDYQRLHERFALLVQAGLVTMLVAFVAAVAVGLARGRADRVRVHRALSTTLWAILLPAAALLALAPPVLPFSP